MVIFFALVFSFIVVGNINESPNNNLEVKPQVKVSKSAENKTSISEIELNPKDTISIKKEIEIKPTKEKVASELIKEEVKPELIKEEVNETKNLDEQGLGWLKLFFYIMGPIFLIILGKYFYNKIRKTPQSSNTTDFLRKNFKEEVQPDNTEQQTPLEEVQPDNTEQADTEEDENNIKK